MKRISEFATVWIVVFAVARATGEAIRPALLAVADTRGADVLEFEGAPLETAKGPPYPIGPRCLIVTINADELAGCHLALGWPMPDRIVDLLLEWRCATNGRRDVTVGGLAGALIWYGVRPAGAVADGGSPNQLRSRLGAVEQLFAVMQGTLDLGRALLRGRYLCAVARIERTGVPVDCATFDRLASDWPRTRQRISQHVDKGMSLYRGQQLDHDALARWLNQNGLQWPSSSNGRLDLSDETFRVMARAHPSIRAQKELRITLDRFSPRTLAIGSDGRNRTALRPFTSSTGRNQPSAKASVLGTATWVHHLIKPEIGSGIALLDWQQQEFGIAAALSGDGAMRAAYESGDPYLALAVAANAVPAHATAASHRTARERFKVCALGVQYGMGAARLAEQVGLSEADGREMLARHRAAYPTFWRWSDGIETHALLRGELQSVFGWRLSVGRDANLRGLRNFPMQANGAEMLRLACCFVTEAGIRVCATIHDAILIEAPLDELDDAIVQTRRLMAEASAIVLDGLALRTDVKTARAPDRWSDFRGSAVWSAVESIVAENTPPAHERDGTCVPTVTRPISYMS